MIAPAWVLGTNDSRMSAGERTGGACKLSRVINVRKLAAIDLYFLGPKIILAEFGLGVPIMFALGILSLRVGLLRTHALWQIALGVYLLLLGSTTSRCCGARSTSRDVALPQANWGTSCTTKPRQCASTEGNRYGCWCRWWCRSRGSCSGVNRQPAPHCARYHSAH